MTLNVETLTRPFHRVIAALALLFRFRRYQHVDPILSVEPEPATPVNEIPPVVDLSPVYDRGENIRWHFRGAVLDRLDEYFSCLRRVKQCDPQSYAFFRRVGLMIPADRYVNPDNLKPNDVAAIASVGFGGISFTADYEHDKDDCIDASFMYFVKCKRPLFVRGVPRGTEIYQLTAVWDERKRGLSPFPCQCYLFADADGTCRVLPEIITTKSKVRVGDRASTRTTIQFQNRSYAVPWWVAELANQKHKEPNELVTGLFRLTALTYAEAIQKIIVRAERDGLTAAFGIDLKRCRYFFKDRELDALAVDGRRKRIFHSVIEHTRQLTTDRSTTVRTHYRGIRHFAWNGTRIRIALPDGVRLDQTGTLVARIGGKPKSGMVDMEEVGAKIGDVLDR